MRSAAIFIASLALTGCFPPPAPAATAPIRQVRASPSPDGFDDQARCLVVFVPGYGSRPEEFIERGFVSRLREHVDADATIVDAHLGYYLEQNIVERLEEDVIHPARAAGYEKIWFVAVSMGALGALGYGATHADEVSGVVLLAPWLGIGIGDVQSDIRGAGGVRLWRAGLTDDAGLDGAAELTAETTQDEFFHLIWAWGAMPVRPDGTSVPIYLGYGQADRWASGQALLADAYPKSHRLLAGGTHEWDVFYEVFSAFVWQGFLQRSCGRQPGVQVTAGGVTSGGS